MEPVTSEGTTVQAIDPDDSVVYRVGGISAIALGLSYLIITGLFLVAGPAAPDAGGGEAWLTYLDNKAAVWSAIVGLSVLTDLLFVPVAAGLYLALRTVNRSAMLLGTGLLVLFVVLDLAITQLNFAALISLSVDYAAASSDAQRSALITAANYPASVVGSSLLGVYVILVPALGVLAISRVMLKGAFSRTAAYVGVLAGILGIVSVVGPFFMSELRFVAIPTAVLTTAWVLLAGYRLLRPRPAPILGRDPQTSQVARVAGRAVRS